MAINTAISWTDHTWNIARGCHKVYDKHPTTGEKVSECEFCYMYRESLNGTRHNPERVAQTSTKPGGAFTLPLRLKEPAMVFTSSLTDFFHKDIDGFRLEVFDIIRRTPHLTYQILTKRPGRIRLALEVAYEQAMSQASNDSAMLTLAYWLSEWLRGIPPANVWLGVSAGYQHTIDKRVPILLSIPAAIHFVSVEPLLEAVDIAKYLGAANGGLAWVIVGGESGNENGQYRYRPCKTEWILQIVDECQKAGTPCWVKQLGTGLQKAYSYKARHATDPAEWPEHLQVQQFPL